VSGLRLDHKIPPRFHRAAGCLRIIGTRARVRSWGGSGLRR
jgi:hypothetical protein